jgi:excisionase family DNA binding protein
MVMTEDRWLSTDEVADYLNVKKGTIYKWIETRNVPAHRVGNNWKFRRDEIAEWVRSTGVDYKEPEAVNTGKPLCNMTLRYNSYLNARLNIKWNLWICSKGFGNC